MKRTDLFSFLNEQMVKLPNGEIELRDDRTKQKRTFELASFLLSKFPVTQDLYFEIMKENPSYFKGDRRPVENVYWKEAVVFCNTLSNKFGLTSCYSTNENDDDFIFDHLSNGFRLPTEAEWQYACQAGTKNIRYGNLNEIAWYRGNSENQTQEVGKKQPNEWGLYDMLGNVWEWCSDIYDESVYGSYRVFKGGGWFDEERSVMATTKRRSHPLKFRIEDLGFRIAKNKIHQLSILFSILLYF